MVHGIVEVNKVGIIEITDQFAILGNRGRGIDYPPAELKNNAWIDAEAFNNRRDRFAHCFIDGNHAYEYIKEDIQLYLPKVRKGGLFGGHDYGHVKGGVKEAVDETFNESQIYLGSNKTWWIWI